ncbi:hypothetical protein NHX12_031412 [Muraenolepis orangiensis]|uniref:PARP catalytic domain-containing protein n=1 Tax=Muraenolepis orangiensis TaxID=630683 RepID=A0A9Q0IIW4_9TELE|nr:hypothetical protein NHX12_031412 [Muraenolepis orangiensis]
MSQQPALYYWKDDRENEILNGDKRMCQGQPQSGQSYTMYHGTTRANADVIIMPSTGPLERSVDGILGRGVYLSRNVNTASRYPIDLPDAQRVVLVVEVTVGKVIAINCKGHPRQENWHDARYGEVFDTAWCPPDLNDNKEEICVWDHNSITVFRRIDPTPRAP